LNENHWAIRGELGLNTVFFTPSIQYFLLIFSPETLLAFESVVLDTKLNSASNTTSQKTNTGRAVNIDKQWWLEGVKTLVFRPNYHFLLDDSP
jgi:hypothetical protein